MVDKEEKPVCTFFKKKVKQRQQRRRRESSDEEGTAVDRSAEYLGVTVSDNRYPGRKKRKKMRYHQIGVACLEIHT